MRFFARQAAVSFSFIILFALLSVEPVGAEKKQDSKTDYRYIANEYFKNGSYPEAIKYYQEAIRINQRDSGGYSGLGKVYCLMGNYPEAIKWCQEAIRVNPKDSQGYAVLGRIYLEMRHYPEAMKWLKQAIKINPHDGLAYDGLGNVYFEMRKFKVALKYYKEGKEKIPYGYACPYQGFGNIYRKLGRSLLAEENFLHEIKEEPYKSAAYYDLATYYFEVGKLEKAEENIDKAMSRAISDMSKCRILGLKGFILITKQEYTAAEELFKGLMKKYGSNSFTLAGLGHVYNAREDYANARLYFNRAIKNKRAYGWAMAMLGLGWVNSNEGRHREAIFCYLEILKENPLNSLALLSMGNAYNWLREYAEAEKYFKQVLEIDANNEYALAQLGTVYLNRGQNKKSEELLEKSLKLNNKTYSCPYEGLGLLYLKQNKLKEAEENFKKAIEINPQIEYKKYNGLAKIYIRQGKYQEAKELLKKSIQNYPYDNEAKEILGQMQGLN